MDRFSSGEVVIAERISLEAIDIYAPIKFELGASKVVLRRDDFLTR